MIRRPPRSTQSRSSAASDVYKRQPQDIRVTGHKKDGLLEQAIVEWSCPCFTAIGVMNRDSGQTEEKLEVIASGNKWQVNDLVESIHSYNGEEKRVRSGDWESILVRRGFAQIIDLSLIHISEPTRLGMISYAVFCLKKKKK